MAREKIETKIEKMIEWVKKYPTAKPSKVDSKHALREYASTQEEYEQLAQEHEEMRELYAYVRVRASKKKVSDELLQRCKEGNIGGVFGYPTRIENLAKEKGTTEENIEYILIKYGTFENFVTLYRSGELSRQDFSLASNIFTNVFDIDFSPNHKAYDRLYRAIMNISEDSIYFTIYSSKGLQEALQTLEPKQQKILEERYGITSDGKMKTLEEIGWGLNVTSSAVKQTESLAFRRLRHPSRQKTFRYYSEAMEERYKIPAYELEEIHALLDQLYASSLLLKNDSAVLPQDREDPRILQGFQVLRNLNSEILSGKIEWKEDRSFIPQPIEQSPAVMPEEDEEEIQVPEEVQEVASKTELEEVREKRALLQEQLKELEEKVAQAKALMQEYDQILGEEQK